MRKEKRVRKVRKKRKDRKEREMDRGRRKDRKERRRRKGKKAVKASFWALLICSGNNYASRYNEQYVKQKADKNTIDFFRKSKPDRIEYIEYRVEQKHDVIA